jgi:N-acetylmuramoyl-L-alanine amidase
MPFLKSTICLLAVSASVAAAQAPFVRLVVPEKDTTRTRSALYRLSGCTNPGNRATLNGVALKVYPSGAFAGGLPVARGENLFTISVTTREGLAATRNFVIVRDTIPSVSADFPVTIDSIMIRPAVDSWLVAGDRLDAQIKGTPGCKATFLNGEPMIEVSPSEAGGIRGVYRGEYVVKPADTLSRQPVRFVLKNDSGASAAAFSRGMAWIHTADLPLCAVTKGDRPALAFGLGDDRLGGAKMSVLVPGVRLAISGKVGSMYRVALAPGRDAWIDETSVELQPRGTRLPSSLTGSWTVQGGERFDEVTIPLSDRLPYVSSTDGDPSRIVVELFGATSNTNWIIQPLTTREIVDASYSQPSTGVLRIELRLRHRQIWGFDISYVGAGLRIRVRRQPEKLAIKRLTFAVDAGHGGSDNRGALGSTGLEERDVNLSMAALVKEILEDRGAQVIMTRDRDTNILNTDRLKKVLASKADIMIAIHANSIGETENPELTRGVSTFYKHLCFRPLSTCILNRVLRTGIPSRGNVGSFNFVLNSPTELPNVLVELAYLSNPEDEMLLMDPDFRKEAAKRIVDGIEDFLDLADD